MVGGLFPFPALLPVETLQDVLKSNSTEKDGEGWEPQWILRYSALIKCRGIITAKGYLMKAVRDVKRINKPF